MRVQIIYRPLWFFVGTGILRALRVAGKMQYRNHKAV